MRVGDTITFTSENVKGKERITSIGGNPDSPPTSQSFPSGVGQQKKGYIPKDPTEFNYMMATRYALDAIIAGAAASPTEAARLIRDLYIATAEADREGGTEARGTSSLSDQISTLAKELNLSGKPWDAYLSKRFKGVTPPTDGQLTDVLDVLHSVKSGKMKFTMTPDGSLATILA